MIIKWFSVNNIQMINKKIYKLPFETSHNRFSFIYVLLMSHILFNFKLQLKKSFMIVSHAFEKINITKKKN